MFKWEAITKCRNCNGEIETVLKLPDQYVVGFVSSAEATKRKMRTGDETPIPLTLVQCKACNYVQLRERVSPDRLYREFWYRSSVNESMRATLREINDDALAELDCQMEEVPDTLAVLDIGSNDGFQLSAWPESYLKVGVDPARNLQAVAQTNAKTPHIFADYFGPNLVPELRKVLGNQHSEGFHVITAISMFYDLEDPVPFLQAVKDVLAPEGVFVIQMNYLLTMLQQNAIDNIAHEHLGYYSVDVLNRLLQRCGLRILSASLNPVNGGSLRVHVTHVNGTGTTPSVENLLKTESLFGLTNPMVYSMFESRCISIRHAMLGALHQYASNDSPLYIHGASTRGTALMQYLFPNGDMQGIEFVGAVERSAEKLGLHMVGSWVPIISEPRYNNDVREFMYHGRKPVSVVLPWHFRDSICAREYPNMVNGARYLFPLPFPRVHTVDSVMLNPAVFQ
jgi:SAM-dependent methyltransferase